MQVRRKVHGRRTGVVLCLRDEYRAIGDTTAGGTAAADRVRGTGAGQPTASPHEYGELPDRLDPMRCRIGQHG